MVCLHHWEHKTSIYTILNYEQTNNQEDIYVPIFPGVLILCKEPHAPPTKFISAICLYTSAIWGSRLLIYFKSAVHCIIIVD
jgi:hypothetical protein